MRVFVDTSAFYSLLDQGEKNHNLARQIWQRLLVEDHTLVTTNYIVVESTALLQKRLGMRAVIDLQQDVLALLRIEWISEALHETSATAHRTANRRMLSFVDCTSFEVCRRLSIGTIFAFDQHFVEQGFTLLADQPD
jgi:predicted nucleic acid-binding protein